MTTQDLVTPLVGWRREELLRSARGLRAAHSRRLAAVGGAAGGARGSSSPAAAERRAAGAAVPC